MEELKKWDCHVASDAPRNDGMNVEGWRVFIGEHGDAPKPGRVPFKY